MYEPLIPTHVIRYEYLIADPKSTLTEIFKFLLNVKSIEKTLIHKLIKKETNDENKTYYQQNEPGYSFRRYSAEQMDFIKSEAGNTLTRLGYVTGKRCRGQIETTEYFENDSKVKESDQYEKDSIVRNQTVSEIKVGDTFDILNRKALINCLSLVDKNSEEYSLLTEKLVDFEINLKSDHIRTKAGQKLYAQKIIDKHSN